jgi:hypothetical protein
VNSSCWTTPSQLLLSLSSRARTSQTTITSCRTFLNASCVLWTSEDSPSRSLQLQHHGQNHILAQWMIHHGSSEVKVALARLLQLRRAHPMQAHSAQRHTRLQLNHALPKPCERCLSGHPSIRRLLDLFLSDSWRCSNIKREARTTVISGDPKPVTSQANLSCGQFIQTHTPYGWHTSTARHAEARRWLLHKARAHEDAIVQRLALCD